MKKKTLNRPDLSYTFLFFLPAIPLLLSVLLFQSCRWDVPETESAIAYDSRITEYLQLIETTGTYEPAMTKVYDKTGAQVAEFIQTYDENGNNTRTDVYEVDENGKKTAREYYLYTYESALYDGTDTFYRVTEGGTYDSTDVKRLWYKVTYDTTYPANYTSITDWALDEDGVTEIKKAYQLCTYLSTSGNYRTEQYFSYDSDDHTTLVLKKEYACWYDADGYPTNELYHVIRGGDEADSVLPEDVPDDSYFHVGFSYDTAGNIYLQSDYLYSDPAGAAVHIPKAANGSFSVTPANADPFAYNVYYEGIGSQIDMILSDFDQLGNLTRDTLYVYGTVQEVRGYSYDSAGEELVSRSRYVGGGKVLDERTEIRFSTATIDGVEYRVKDSLTYLFNGTSSNGAASKSLSGETEKSGEQAEPDGYPGFRKIRSRHLR